MNPIRPNWPALVAGGLVLTLTACGGSAAAPGATSSAGAQKSLEVFSWWTSGSESAALKAMIDGYLKTSPGVNVVNGAVAGGGGGNAQAVLQTRLQGGDPPDIWQTHPGAAIQQYISGNLLADASSVYTGEVKSAIPATMVEAISAGGKQYGVSAGAHRGNVLWYNKRLLEKAGVTLPGADYPTSTFLADLAKLKAAGVVPLCLGAKDTFATAELFENTLLGSLGADGWKQLTGGGTGWDGEKVKAAAADTAKMLQYADPDAGAMSWDQATKKLASGGCAFESMGDWAYGELVKNGAKEGETFGYTAHPGTGGSFVAVVDTMVMAAGAKNPAEATAFLQAVASKDVQLAFNKEKGSVPLRTDVDVSSLSPYQQQSAKSFAGDAIVQSVVHGEAMTPQFTQALFDAVTQFAQSKNVDAFVQALADAARS